MRWPSPATRRGPVAAEGCLQALGHPVRGLAGLDVGKQRGRRGREELEQGRAGFVIGARGGGVQLQCAKGFTAGNQGEL